MLNLDDDALVFPKSRDGIPKFIPKLNIFLMPLAISLAKKDVFRKDEIITVAKWLIQNLNIKIWANFDSLVEEHKDIVDPERYFRKALKNTFIDYQRAQNREFNRFISIDTDNNSTVEINIVEKPSQDLIRNTNKELFKSIVTYVSTLTPNEETLFHFAYLQYSTKVIARYFGVSTRTINRRMVDLFDTIQKEFPNNKTD